jgi:hypothetical protein
MCWCGPCSCVGNRLIVVGEAKDASRVREKVGLWSTKKKKKEMRLSVEEEKRGKKKKEEEKEKEKVVGNSEIA